MPASDDVVALVLALRHAEVQIEAITVVAGNIPVAQGVQNGVCKKLCVWDDFFAEKIIPYTQFFTNSKIPLWKYIVTICCNIL